jgi:glycosyltransferase involved in cell wall biosynthesis
MISTFHLVHNLDNSYGGPAKSIPYLMGSLNDLGHSQEVISLKFKENETNEVVEKLKLDSTSFKVWFTDSTAYSPFLRNYLIKRISEEKNQVIHYHNLWNYIPLVANAVSKKMSVPVIVSPRGNLYEWNLNKGFLKKKLYLNIFQNDFFNSANCIHVTSKEELHAVKKLGYKSPVGLIPNGVDQKEFENMKTKKEHLKNLGLSDNYKYILYMGRIEKKKGLNFLFEAFIDFGRSNPNWKIIVAGPAYDQAYYNECKNFIEDAGFGNSIIWLGMVTGDKRIDAYGGADLFVLPTHSENFGIVIAEALSAGLPVITTDGTPWMEIQNEFAGFIISLNKKNLLLAIENFNNLKNYEKKEMSLSAKNIAKRYTWNKSAEDMQQLYQWTLGEIKQPNFIY